MFLNLSNHPSPGWEVAQRGAAEALGGEIRDLPFPAVAPTLSAAAIVEVGDALVRKAIELAPAAAMVQGEYTLTVYVAAALESQGIPCYAATTERVVESVPSAPGEKRSHFAFVAFRRYVIPRHSAAEGHPAPKRH